MEHHANAFFVAEGHCFRLVNGMGGKKGQPHHCPEPVIWRGRFQTPLGVVHVVWACDGHAGDLRELRPV
jgi:hypothetical protein